MRQAINYALGQWSDLNAYLLDGRVELDNNLIENAFRPTKLGQKNWLFLGSERGGEMAAVAFRPFSKNSFVYRRERIS